jgi:putative DNA primase/helicase
MLTKHNKLVGIDLDHARDPDTGVITPEAQAILDRMQTYTEVSPSGTGLHLFCRGQLPPGGRKRGPIEMYETTRYLTVTGCHVEGTPARVEARQIELDAFHAEVFSVKQRSQVADPSSGDHASPPPLDDDTLRAYTKCV